MTDEEAKLLIKKYNAGECTEEEVALLDDWYMQLQHESVGDWQEKVERISAVVKARLEQMLEDERGADRSRKVGFLQRLPRLDSWLIASAAALAIAAAGYLISRNDLLNRDSKPMTATVIQPGSNKASLVLADGSTIVLDGRKTGIVASGEDISYLDGSKVSAGAASSSPLPGLQVLRVPRGGQFNLVLPDGTEVWLNAESSLKFPSSFAGVLKREVELSGEAFFKVKPDKKHPFVVRSGGQMTQVFGTSFNISCYANEPVITTLVEGSVSLNMGKILRPGEQSHFERDEFVIRQVDTDMAVAWTKGEFIFRKEPLGNILAQISRWYDVSFVYGDPEVKRQIFGGAISRSDQIIEVLSMLERTGDVKFKIEGRRIAVTK
ncbi:FecR family protein [Pedobacter sp. GR22-6]|uniref:FecR family protein n=1 Tax=Pedobacter sp. GR22-6 TaxID=3127957 RepID=UPI00307D96A8